MNIYSSVVITIILIIVSPLRSQCIKDYLGTWRSIDNCFITLTEEEKVSYTKIESTIGKNNISFSGHRSYRSDTIQIKKVEYKYDKDGEVESSVKKIFTFKVVEVNRQYMIIQVLSDAMKVLFGSSEVLLFNEEHMPVDEIIIDSLIFSRWPYPYKIKIYGNKHMKLEEIKDGRKKSKYYTGELNNLKMKKLHNLLIKSKIFSISPCEMRSSCSDCYPMNLEIFYESNKVIKYRKGIEHSSMDVLIREIYSIVSSTSWTKVKRRNNLISG